MSAGELNERPAETFPKASGEQSIKMLYDCDPFLFINSLREL